ncbi:hypothetical protein [Rhodopirellula halodulae]|uniref:hypothetical protein n=1 Tax=Rhodopirellula halodulae TaxID=2894198 RepID=UPI001E536F60|nr:hypothetical protein [Rhodopirellula sp. JC737]MCC9658823.1 hypothetical protein [Rhodopirellula sp. JC737]
MAFHSHRSPPPAYRKRYPTYMTGPYEPPNALAAPPGRSDLAASRTRTQCVAGRVVASVVCVTSALGLLYNFSSIPSLLSRDDSTWTAPPYFEPAYSTMSFFCTSFYTCLIYYSTRLWTGRYGASRAITCLLAAEVGYFFASSFLWVTPTIGRGVAAATGVANGGLMVQFLILLPLWAPIVFASFRLYDQRPTRSGG